MSVRSVPKPSAAGHRADAPASIWRLVSRGMNSIVTFNKCDGGIPFYCVHSISGDVGALKHLAHFLGPEQPVYGIQVPKEKMNAAFAGSVEAMARHYVETLATFQPEGPLVLGGWSAGAIIALEMAQQLQALGRDVPLLVALDGAPCNTGAGIKPWNPLYGCRLARNLPLWIRDYWSHRDFRSHKVRWRVFSGRLARSLAARPRVAPAAVRGEQTLHGSAVQGLLRVNGWSSGQTAFISAVYDAVRTYVPERYPGRVLVYETRTQPLHRLLQIGAVWTAIARHTEIVPISGNHLSMVRKPLVEGLATDLRRRLAALPVTALSDGLSNRPAPPKTGASLRRRQGRRLWAHGAEAAMARAPNGSWPTSREGDATPGAIL